MATDGSSQGGTTGPDDVPIVISAEDKLTAVFQQMSESIDDKLAKMVEAINRRAESVDAGFEKMAESSKKLDRIGDSVEHIEDRFGSLWKTILAAGGAFVAWKGFSWLKESLADTPIGKAGSAAADSVAKRWDDMIGRLNGRFKPEIDALASGLQYLGDVAVQVVIPELESVGESIADLFFNRLSTAGVNANTFTDNVSNNFKALAFNVARLLAVMEVGFRNWDMAWQAATTSAAIAILDAEDGFKKLANSIDSVMVSAARKIRYYWERFFDWVFAELQRLNDSKYPSFLWNSVGPIPGIIAGNIVAGPAKSPWKLDPNKVGNQNIPPAFDVAANDGARKILEGKLNKIVQGLNENFGVNLERILEKIGLINFAPARLNKPQDLAAGAQAGATANRPTANLWETGFLTRAGSDTFDPGLATQKAQLAELKDTKRLHIQALERLDAIKRWADAQRAKALGAQPIQQ